MIEGEQVHRDLEAPTEQAIVTACDGTVFYCHVETADTVPPQRRWVYDTATTSYAGPSFDGPLTLECIRDAVNDWWRLRSKSASAPDEGNRP